MRQSVDVAIIGGGLAGLSLALQVSQRRPGLAVTVVEPRRRPYAERTGTVGESFSELGSHYFRDVLGLADHLDSRQLPKLGLRFFVGAQPDLADRFELGVQATTLCEMEGDRLLGLPLRTHQVDRGRLENELARRCVEAGVTLLEGTRVARVELDSTGHRLHLEGDVGERLDARWVVFATGPGGPAAPTRSRSLGHRTRAAWFRVDGDLDPGRWSARPAFLDEMPVGLRRLSTTHFMGRGYWIWMIPLPSGATSLGVVADPSVVDLDVSDRAGVLEWIAERDPRVAEELAGAAMADDRVHRASLVAGVAERCYSPDRWAVVGQAAGLVDVLYSPGADMIALGNTMAVDLIEHDLDCRGRLPGRCAIADRIFSGFAEGLAEIYRGQYAHFGRPELLGTKVLWDSAVYFGFNTLLFRHGLSGDARFLSSIQPDLVTLQRLQSRVQGRFRSGEAVPLVPGGSATVEWGSVDWMMDPYFGARSQPDPMHVAARLRSVLAVLERVGRRIEGSA